MRRVHRTLWSLVAALSLLTGATCRALVEPEAPDFVEYGWELLEAAEDAGEFRAALEQFKAGVGSAQGGDPEFADGWNGQGWTYAKLGVADSSDLLFTTAITKEADSVVATERLAGRSFANLAQGEFSEAVTDAKNALLLIPNWEFRRLQVNSVPTITYAHITLTAATGFYGLGEFDSCLVWIRKLDATFSANVTTLAGRSRLGEKLKSLTSGLIP